MNKKRPSLSDAEELKDYDSLVTLDDLREIFPDIDDDKFFESTEDRSVPNVSLSGKSYRGTYLINLWRKNTQEDIEYKGVYVYLSIRAISILKLYAKAAGVTYSQFLETALMSSGEHTPQWARSLERMSDIVGKRRLKTKVKKRSAKAIEKVRIKKEKAIAKQAKKQEKKLNDKREQEKALKALFSTVTEEEIKGNEFLDLIRHAKNIENQKEEEQPDFDKMPIEDIEKQIGDAL